MKTRCLIFVLAAGFWWTVVGAKDLTKHVEGILSVPAKDVVERIRGLVSQEEVKEAMLGVLGKYKKWGPHLRFQNHPDTVMLRRTIFYLGEMKEEWAIDPLSKLLMEERGTSAVPRIREHVKKALNKLSPLAPERMRLLRIEIELSWLAFAGASDLPTDKERIAFILSLGRREDVLRVLLNFLERYQNDPAEYVPVRSAISYLLKMGKRRALEPISEILLEKRTSSVIPEFTVLALGRWWDAEEAKGLLVKVLDPEISETHWIRRYAAEGLARTADLSVIPALQAAADLETIEAQRQFFLDVIEQIRENHRRQNR